MTITLERPGVNGLQSHKIAVGYRRISDPKQPGGSMDTQASQIMAFIESQGYTFGGMYADEESGLLEMRPDYQRMIEDARSGDFQVVVIPRFDRFGRDDAEYFPRLREFQKLGIEVLSATEPNGNSFVRGVLILMANEESRRLSMRITPNKLRLAGEGFWNTNPPTGYDVARLMADGTLVPSETATQEQRKASIGAVLVANEYAEAVTEAFKMYAEGRATLNGVMDYMRASGLAITRQGILRILRNRAYIGKVVYGVQAKSQFITSQTLEVKGRHQPLIDEDTFERVQERMGANKRLTRAAIRGKHMLSGLVFCGLCGSKMKASVANGYVSYACRSRKGEISTIEPCTMKYISGRKLDALTKEKVVAALKPLALEDEAREKVRERLQGAAAKRLQDGDKERKALERRKAELEETLTKVEDSFFAGLLGQDRYIKRRDDVTLKIQEAQKKIDALPKAPKVDMTGMFNMLDSIEWESLSDEGWRHLLTALTDGVVWKNGEAAIQWKPEWEAMLSAS